MPRYIDADKLSESVTKRFNDSAIRNWLLSLINAEPTADVVEVKRGEWISIPVKILDTIYLIGNITEKIHKAKVIGMWIYDNEIQMITDKGIVVSEWYRTREDAERELNERIVDGQLVGKRQ